MCKPREKLHLIKSVARREHMYLPHSEINPKNEYFESKLCKSLRYETAGGNRLPAGFQHVLGHFFLRKAFTGTSITGQSKQGHFPFPLAKIRPWQQGRQRAAASPDFGQGCELWGSFMIAYSLPLNS